MVINTLDKYEGKNDIILRLLAKAQSLKKVRLRVLVISRLEVLIRYGFYQIPNTKHVDFILYNIEVAIIDYNIFVFLDYEI